MIKASPRNVLPFKSTPDCGPRCPLSSTKDTHLKSLTIAEFVVLNEISDEWVDLSTNFREPDESIIRLPRGQGEVDKADGHCSNVRSDREVQCQSGDATPAQEQQELGMLATTGEDKKFILQEALQAARVAVRLDSAGNLMKAIEKYEQSSLLLEEIGDLSEDTEDGRKLKTIVRSPFPNFQGKSPP